MSQSHPSLCCCDFDCSVRRRQPASSARLKSVQVDADAANAGVDANADALADADADALVFLSILSSKIY